MTNEIIAIIERVGFPVFVCMGGGYILIQMIGNMFNRIIEDSKEDKELLKSELEYNRKIGCELLETNKLLAQDLSNKVENLTDKIDSFIEKHN